MRDLIFVLLQPRANELKYNQGMMRFLEEQLKKAEKVNKMAAQSPDELKGYYHTIKKGHKLLCKHRCFLLKSFHKTNDARQAVERICGDLSGYLGDWGLQAEARLEYKIPEEVVNADKHHLYMLLAYVLLDEKLSPELRGDWEAVKADYKMALKGLQVISDAEIQLDEKVANGSYGNVYKGKWQGVAVAVKDVALANPELSLENFASFFREPSLQASLTFEYITPLYAITDSGKMVMQLASCDLTEWCRRPGLTWSAKRRALHQAALGLRHLHSRHPPLIHHDVKSSNFLVFGKDLETCAVKISDFGLTVEDPGSRSMTSSGAGGTMEYIAPEVYYRKPLTRASDVFSFGVVIYEVVTGKHPYGVAGSLEAGAIVLGAKCSGKEPAEVKQGQCPPEMLEFMRRCIAREPDERPTMDEICTTLEEMDQ